MLFKILHGDKSRISTDITPYHEGYCYVTHDGSFYVDMNNERVKLNAQEAEKLTGYTISDILNSSEVEIPTSKAVWDAISAKADATHNHDNKYYTKDEINGKLNDKSDINHTHDDYATTEQVTNLKAVSYTAQSLTEEQKVVARENIGASAPIIIRTW